MKTWIQCILCSPESVNGYDLSSTEFCLGSLVVKDMGSAWIQPATLLFTNWVIMGKF